MLLYHGYEYDKAIQLEMAAIEVNNNKKTSSKAIRFHAPAAVLAYIANKSVNVLHTNLVSESPFTN